MKNLLKIVVLLGLVAIALVIFTPTRAFPAVNGNQITVDEGRNHIEGVLQPLATYEFLLKDEGVSLGAFHGDAFITIMPLATAEQFKAQYGDFFQCDNPGATQSQSKLEAVIFVAGNAQARMQIKEALSLVDGAHIPVVRFTGALVQVTGYKVGDTVVQYTNQVPIYYIQDFEIIQTDYLP